MGSPQYGQLVLDGQAISGSVCIETRSLLWSRDGQWLAAQELVSWNDQPTTRVVVFDTERRQRVVSSPALVGIGNPVRFEHGQLVYRHWNQHGGEQEMLLNVVGG